MKKFRFLQNSFFPVSGIFLFLLVVAPWFNTVNAQKIRVDNIRYELKENNIEIYYDLIGQASKDYKVSVVLKRENDAAFSVTPVSLQGDIGKGKFAGEGRKIIWNYTNEFKPEAGVTDYYFEVSAKKPSKTWLFVAGGILVAGGTATAILLSGGKDNTTNPPVVNTFPVPSRPPSGK